MGYLLPGVPTFLALLAVLALLTIFVVATATLSAKCCLARRTAKGGRRKLSRVNTATSSATRHVVALARADRKVRSRSREAQLALGTTHCAFAANGFLRHAFRVR